VKKVPLKDYLERIIDEKDMAVKAALASQEKAVAAAFHASEKAIEKAETAQTAYNARSNEFRAAIDDQSKLLLTRTEADVRFQQLREMSDTQGKEIVALRLAQSQGEGGSKATKEVRTNSQWLIGFLAGIAMFLLGLYLSRK